MIKYVRVLEDNFLWSKNAILSYNTETQNGYSPIDDIWDTTEKNGGEYISTAIIEAPENSKYFERVYPISDLKKKLFGTKKQAQAAASALYEGDN